MFIPLGPVGGVVPVAKWGLVRRSQSGGCLVARKVNTVCVDVFYLRIAVGRGMTPGRGVPPTGRTLLRFFPDETFIDLCSTKFSPKSFVKKNLGRVLPEGLAPDYIGCFQKHGCFQK